MIPNQLFGLLRLHVGQSWLLYRDLTHPNTHGFTVLKHGWLTPYLQFFGHWSPRHNGDGNASTWNKNRYWTNHFPIHGVKRRHAISKSWDIQKGDNIQLTCYGLNLRIQDSCDRKHHHIFRTSTKGAFQFGPHTYTFWHT